MSHALVEYERKNEDIERVLEETTKFIHLSRRARIVIACTTFGAYILAAVFFVRDGSVISGLLFSLIPPFAAFVVSSGIFVSVLKKSRPELRCKTGCGKSFDALPQWICANCGEKHNTGRNSSYSISYVGPCVRCRHFPTAVVCTHCRAVVVLDADTHEHEPETAFVDGMRPPETPRPLRRDFAGRQFG